MGYKITIDGPSGTGKGYVAHEISKKLGILYIDTGAMYRAFSLYCENNNVSLEDEANIKAALERVDLDLVYEGEMLRILLNGVDVSQDIRNEQVGLYASKVSAIPIVRQHMIQRQRELAGKSDVVMEGRDIGSVVFPNAELKIFLTADAAVRAERRYKDLVKKDRQITFEQVLEDIKRRDEADLTRPISPLIKTDDMIQIDTTNLNKEQVVSEVLKLVKQKGWI